MSTEALQFEVLDPIPPKLREIANQLKETGKAEPKTVRELLAMFGAQRRGYQIVNQIDSALDQLGIMTDPYFEYAWIDGTVDFVLADGHKVVSAAVEAPAAIATAAVGAPTVGATTDASTNLAGASVDPTFRIGRLSAANQVITSVKVQDTISFAITLMLKSEYSQLPIMQNEREVKGIISWSSIGARMALGLPCEKVGDCQEVHREVSSEDSLFAVIPAIVEYGYVLIRAVDNKISGIVTASDLSLQFRQLAEPFLLLGEIEQHVRRLIEGKFTKAELEGARNPTDNTRPIERVADLSLGECIRLLENPQRWEKLTLKIDRVAFLTELDKVRQIRNDVMHFDPDPLGESDLNLLRSFVRFLRKLQDMFPVASSSHT